MALAAGDSALCTGPLTLHTESAIHIAEQLTGAKFTIRNIFINIPSFGAYTIHKLRKNKWGKFEPLI